MPLFILLTGISTCLKAWILWLGKQREVLAEFRWFFVYIVYALAESIARVGVSNHRNEYLYVYWITESLTLVLLAIAVGESLAPTLRPFAFLKGVRIAFWACVVVPVAYVVTRSTLEPPAHATPAAQVIVGVEITLNYLVVAMTALYLFVLHFLDVYERRYETGIILGFGLNASLSACGYLIRSIFGTKLIWLSRGLPPVAFLIAEGVWVATLLRPPVPEVPPAISLTLDEIIEVLDKQMEVLRRLFRKD